MASHAQVRLLERYGWQPSDDELAAIGWALSDPMFRMTPSVLRAVKTLENGRSMWLLNLGAFGGPGRWALVVWCARSRRVLTALPAPRTDSPGQAEREYASRVAKRGRDRKTVKRERGK